MNIKVLKLRSGEEIACQIVDQNDANFKIFQPMIFKTISSLDDLGRPFDITTLSDWLVNTDNKNVDLPSNHIAFITEPNTQTLELYKSESEREFKENEIQSTLHDTSDDVKEIANKITDADLFGMFLEDLFKNSMNNEDKTPKSSKRKKKKKKETYPTDLEDPSELDRHMIMMQLYIPAESIMNLVTAGVIDPKTLLDMIKEVKKRNKFTGDEKTREDFGNKFSDWNPDPESNDYK
jgi:hypothetical protein